MLRPGIPVEADHVLSKFYEDGWATGLARTFEWQGAWRFLGFSLVGLSVNLHPFALPVLSLLTHIAGVYFFVCTSGRLLGNRRVALGLGVILATLPLGYQVLTWGAIYTVVLSVLVLWVQLWLMVRYADRLDKQAGLFLAIALLTLAGALAHEGLLGTALATCAWSWLRRKPTSLSAILSDMKTYYVGWAPFVGAAVYVAGYYAFRPDFVVKAPGIFNPRSLLSVYYHTTSALAVFGAWGSPLMRDLGFDSWTMGATALAVALAVVLAALTAYGLSRIPARDEEPPNLFRAGATISCLLLGTSLIYAIGGGFSPESRKLYPVCYVMALAAGFVLVRMSLHRVVRPAVVALVVACCVPTAWLLTGVWCFEATRHHELARVLAENDIHSPIELRSDTDPHEAWPYLTKSYGFRLYDPWLLDYTLGSLFPSHGADLREDAPGNPTVLRYERRRGWSVLSEETARPRGSPRGGPP